ncbi:MAG TPA: hypothetical protein VNF73_08535 [Candidatus Saccharimonadales bacterium]|nr:hypothetical protein [Candidatus Saccharimonadales bacterium]
MDAIGRAQAAPAGPGSKPGQMCGAGAGTLAVGLTAALALSAAAAGGEAFAPTDAFGAIGPAGAAFGTIGSRVAASSGRHMMGCVSDGSRGCCGSGVKVCSVMDNLLARDDFDVDPNDRAVC